MTRRTRVRTAGTLLLVASVLAPDRARPGALDRWVNQTFAPAMRQINDPELAHNWRGSGRPRPSPNDIRASCTAALSRHERWDDRLRRVPVEEIGPLLADYVKDDRDRLRACAEEGAPPSSSVRLAEVQAALHRLGVKFPQG